MVILVKKVQNELVVKIFSKILLVKYYSLDLARTPIKAHKGDNKWPLFVNKQLFWWSASITLDNNNDVFTDFHLFFLLYTLPHTSVGLTSCISDVLSVLNILTHLTNVLPFGSL